MDFIKKFGKRMQHCCQSRPSELWVTVELMNIHVWAKKCPLEVPPASRFVYQTLVYVTSREHQQFANLDPTRDDRNHPQDWFLPTMISNFFLDHVDTISSLRWYSHE